MQKSINLGREISLMPKHVSFKSRFWITGDKLETGMSGMTFQKDGLDPEKRKKGCNANKRNKYGINLQFCPGKHSRQKKPVECIL